MKDITPDGLKKCPFCNGDAALVNDDEEKKFPIFAICWSCGCKTGNYELGYEKYVVKVWNRRVS